MADLPGPYSQYGQQAAMRRGILQRYAESHDSTGTICVAFRCQSDLLRETTVHDYSDHSPNGRGVSLIADPLLWVLGKRKKRNYQGLL